MTNKFLGEEASDAHRGTPRSSPRNERFANKKRCIPYVVLCEIDLYFRILLHYFMPFIHWFIVFKVAILLYNLKNSTLRL